MKALTPNLVKTDRFIEMYSKTCRKLSGIYDGIAVLPSLGEAGNPDDYIKKEANRMGIPIVNIERFIASDQDGFVTMLIRYRQGLKDSYFNLRVHRPRGERGPRRK